MDEWLPCGRWIEWIRSYRNIRDKLFPHWNLREQILCRSIRLSQLADDVWPRYRGLNAIPRLKWNTNKIIQEGTLFEEAIRNSAPCRNRTGFIRRTLRNVLLWKTERTVLRFLFPSRVSSRIERSRLKEDKTRDSFPIQWNIRKFNKIIILVRIANTLPHHISPINTEVFVTRKTSILLSNVSEKPSTSNKVNLEKRHLLCFFREQSFSTARTIANHLHSRINPRIHQRIGKDQRF